MLVSGTSYFWKYRSRLWAIRSLNQLWCPTAVDLKLPQGSALEKPESPSQGLVLYDPGLDV